MIYTLSDSHLTVSYDPEALSLTAAVGAYSVSWANEPFLRLADGTILSFRSAHCESAAYKTGVADGVRAVFSDFRGEDGTVYPFSVHTFVYLDAISHDLHTEARIENAELNTVAALAFPARFGYDAKEGEGYTILPRMQGTLVPAGHPITIANGFVFERDAYIPVYGQMKNGAGWTAIWETPCDARYQLVGEEVQPWFAPSLGSFAEKRVMMFRFFEKEFDYNVLAFVYRRYLAERGELVTLQEKIARNPRVAELIGTPIVHTGSAVHISPKSAYYTEGAPEKNDHYTPFSATAEGLRGLKKRGADKVYLHLDGWGNHGYDNLHPDVFPPNEACGGADGMRDLQKTCNELGYLFGIHDQYRDYYYDAPTFSLDNAIQYADGSHPYCSVWYGGPHSFLCATLAPSYVRRNYNKFDALDIHLDGSYLDVFSVVELDECFNPDHPMTRKQCAAARRECLDILSDRGIIPSSEEVLGAIVNSQVLCHHAPFYTTDLGSSKADPVGVPIPLLNLVYHDCVIIPWFGLTSHGGWGLPGNDWGFLWALLCGDTIYYDINETAENIAFGKIALELHKRVALCSLVSHEILDGNIRHRRSTFSDGTVVEADFDREAFVITYPDGTGTSFGEI